MHPSDLSLHLKVVQALPAQARILFKISCPCASPGHLHCTLRPSSRLRADSVQDRARPPRSSFSSAAAAPPGSRERVCSGLAGTARALQLPARHGSLVQRRTWRSPHTTQSEPCGRLPPWKVTNFEKV